MRVGIIGLAHESNTFISQPTTFAHFEQDILLTGEKVRAKFATAPHEIGGFLEGLAANGIEAVPIFSGRAMPFGVIEGEAFSRVLEIVWAELDKAHLGGAGPLDGILVAPHGAAVSEIDRDADGYWLSLLRQRVGPALPIIGTLDPHGNLSQRMVDSANALVSYRSNPHLDQKARGLEAADLMARTLRGEIRPTMAAAFPPLAINIERQRTAEPHCRKLYALADEMLKRPGVLSDSVMLGFPYSDVEEMGSALIVVTDNDPQLARKTVDELAGWLWTHRQEFVGELLSIDDALARAATLPAPVCLLDMGDNVGGGSPGDSTFLIRALHERKFGPSCACLWDPESAAQATAAGVGARISMKIGGKTDKLHGEPLAAECIVVSLYDGKFREDQVRHGGFTEMDQGPSAVVRTDSGLTLLLATRRIPPFSLKQLTSAGIVPGDYKYIVTKGVHAPVAAYEVACPSLLRVNTDGVTTADMGKLVFHHRRKPLFPFEEV